MRFGIRPGFKIYCGDDAPGRAFLHQKGGVREGGTVDLTTEEAGILRMRGQLGALIPLDRQADDFFGDTKPLPPPTIVPYCHEETRNV